MRSWRIVLVGCGTVGRGALARLAAARTELHARGCDARVVGVLDPATGSAVLPSGMEPERLLSMIEAGEGLDHYPGAEAVDSLDDALSRVDADVIFEATPTDLSTGGAGLEHVRTALVAGVNVCTTNKGPFALDYDGLSALAAQHGVRLLGEGTVMSGTPVLNLFESGLAGAGVRGLRGVLNGTCNFIFSEMEKGSTYADALARAQELGYAETDPAGDVEGHDAAAKMVILARVVLGEAITLDDVECEGIDGFDAATVRDDLAAGYRWRLVGEAHRHGDRWAVSVGPRRLPADDPLATGSGPANLLVFDTDALGAVTISGPGAGRDETGHALVADLLTLHTGAGG